MAFARRTGSSLLQKHPNDVVLLSAVRSPIGRAFKGGYKDAHPEDILMPVQTLRNDSRTKSKLTREP